MIEVTGLTVRFAGVTPIDDMSVVFPEGTCGLIGPNGAGKTTFFNVLSGFVKPAAGTVTAFGQNLLKLSDYKRARWGLRRTFQTEMAIEQLSVYDNVALIHEHSGAKGSTRRSDVLAAIEFVGLETPPTAKVGGLGARERRLVEVARAVVGRPRVVLLDEPAAGLPDEETVHLSTVIQKIPTEVGALVILVDHDMSLVSACCETTAVVDFGKLVASGPTAEVLRDEHVMRAYLGTETFGVDGEPEPVPVSENGAPLRIEGLSIARGGKPVVHEISLEIPRGAVTTLLGPNGAGKSTMVLTIGGVLRPSAGTVSIGDENLTRLRPERIRKAGVAIVPEGRRLLPDLSVNDNLRVATYALSREHAKSGIDYALEVFPQLKARWSAIARTLSGGEQQMVVLAQALVSRPKFILVDELSLGLAPVVVKRLMPALERAASEGVGVLLIEQFVHVALALAESAYVIEGGRIVYHGTAAELKEHPERLHSAYLLRERVDVLPPTEGVL